MGEHSSHNSMRRSALSVHRDSRAVAKMVRPKIKIIHVVAPEIIKTDVENFRELVQRLTGPGAPRKKEKAEKERALEKKIKCKVEVEDQEGGIRGGVDHHHHHEVWVDSNPGGFLNFLNEEECWMGDFLQPLGSSRVDLVGEMYAS